MGGKSRHPNSLANLEKGKWKKGQSGNPKGGYPLPDYVKNAKALDRKSVEKFFAAFTEMSLEELKEKANDKTMTVLEGMICQLIIKSLEQGDNTRFDFLLNRTIGKVMDRVEHTVAKPMVIERPSGDQVILATTDTLEGKSENNS